MLNLEETIKINTIYQNQRNFLFKSFCYSTSVIIIVDIFREQVPEINLLQLIPGFYLFILFISFIGLVAISNFFITIPINIETRKLFGTKTLAKFTVFLSFKLSFFFFFFLLIVSLNSIIPISLDSFNSYGEKTLENLWSFNEVINLEIILLFILTILSQMPFLINCFLVNEREVIFLPSFWRPLTLLIFIISGFLTPTIDGYTQLSFSISSFSIYLMIISLLEKRLNIKFKGHSIFGF
jgi:hypothetical protein